MRISDWSSDVCSSDLPEFSAMLDSAIAGGNDGEIDTVVKYAGRRAPWAQDAMKKRVNAWRTDRRLRSEERRVGKEGVSKCRYRWSPVTEKKTKKQKQLRSSYYNQYNTSRPPSH